ncbi:sulfotransferase [Candidatus Nanopelagicales bacterium]|nr:sulfotransferase [Candidatus Nanopelagicales bacterium]
MDVPEELLREHFAGPFASGPSPVAGKGESAPYAFAPIGTKAPPPGQEERRVFIDKDTRHVYRLPLLLAMFPQAKFIWITRDSAEVVDSLVRAWQHPRFFFSYQLPEPLDINGYTTPEHPWTSHWWNVSLPPSWRDYTGADLRTVCSGQVQSALAHVEEYRSRLNRNGSLVTTTYADVVADPRAELERIGAFIGLSAEGVAKAAAPAPQLVSIRTPNSGGAREDEGQDPVRPRASTMLRQRQERSKHV